MKTLLDSSPENDQWDLKNTSKLLIPTRVMRRKYEVLKCTCTNTCTEKHSVIQSIERLGNI